MLRTSSHQFITFHTHVGIESDHSGQPGPLLTALVLSSQTILRFRSEYLHDSIKRAHSLHTNKKYTRNTQEIHNMDNMIAGDDIWIEDVDLFV